MERTEFKPNEDVFRASPPTQTGLWPVTPLFSSLLILGFTCQLHTSRALLLASRPLQKHGSFCLFLQASTSRLSPDPLHILTLHPQGLPLRAISLNSPSSFLGRQPQVSGQQSGLLTRLLQYSAALPFPPPPVCPAVFQPQLTPAVFSSPGSLTQLPFPLSSLPPTRLPHSALGPSPWPQEVCLSIVLHFQH